nr:DUF3954 domain-containing protein [Domibacillus aminovorans]
MEKRSDQDEFKFERAAKTMYVVKDGQLIPHEPPDYGETVVITIGGKVDRLETTQKRKI